MTDPTPEPEIDDPDYPCTWSDGSVHTIYLTQQRAQAAGSDGQAPAECPAGHWHNTPNTEESQP